MFGKIKVRKGQPDPKLDQPAFMARFREQFYDPRFEVMRGEIDKLGAIAWQNYEDHRKAPITVKAGAGAVDPDYDLSTEWVANRDRLIALQKAQPTAPLRVLLINGSPRNEHTCPGEMSKTFRIVQTARKAFESNGIVVDELDLSRLTAEYGKKIYPCKACVSTAMPLCHWPCSCYPNHSLAQTGDWMGEIYEKWVAAHGIMFVTPVHWYQAPSVLKLMIDRLVCADGGNPDPSSTHGKTAEEAKQLEVKGWDYPKHLEGRAYSVLAHGDSNGADDVRRALTDWLNDMHLVQAGPTGVLSQYIGYEKPYATSHDELDEMKDFLKEVENLAISLTHQVNMTRSGYQAPDKGIVHPIQK